MYTAPWKYISQQSNFYDDLSFEDASALLKRERNHSYLWTDFDGHNIKLIVRNDPNITEHNFNLIPLNVTDYNFALSQSLFHIVSCRTLNYCGLADICKFEANTRSPKSLLNLSRQVISQHFNFHTLLDAHLPPTLYSYLLTEHQTPSHCVSICDTCLTMLME